MATNRQPRSSRPRPSAGAHSKRAQSQRARQSSAPRPKVSRGKASGAGAGRKARRATAATSRSSAQKSKRTRTASRGTSRPSYASYAQGAKGSRKSRRGNGGGKADRSRSSAPIRATRTANKAQRPSAYDVPTPEQAMVTRRHFLIGAGVVVAAAVTAGSVAVVNQRQSTPTIDTLSVSSDNVTTLSNYDQADVATAFTLAGDYTLPYGTQLWNNDDAMAACLIPTDQASPLSLGAVLDLTSGKYTIVLEQANGQGEGFEIYDIRGTSQGLVWTECNIFENTWRVLCAGLSGTSLSNTRIVDSGDGDLESPSLAAVGDHAYWTVMPSASADNASTATAQVKRASFSGGDAEVVYQSTGRMACPLYADNDGIVLAPHHPDSSRYYQLVRIDTSGDVTDTLTLPSGMQPNEIGYGPNGFSFCFESIYSFGDGIANLGTYCRTASGGDYSGADWFRFGRTPLAAPASCGDDWFIVKSTQSVAAVNFAQKSYCTFDLLSGCTNWGDYLATSGTHDRIVTVAQVDSSTAETQNQACRVRVWKQA